jgi:hypothetical protein
VRIWSTALIQGGHALVRFDSVFFGWMDSTSVGPPVHDVPLRWSGVPPRVVVRRFHNARDDPPPAKVLGGREINSAQARQA